VQHGERTRRRRHVLPAHAAFEGDHGRLGRLAMGRRARAVERVRRDITRISSATGPIDRG
jgi:hypothetical protein